MSKNLKLKDISEKWFLESIKNEYSYHFTWLGRPIIQYPQDIIALQEIIWKTKPDLIIETGIARGGSIIFSASLLELIGKGEIVGIDIDIRIENKRAIKNHPLNKRITMLEGSSIDKNIFEDVKKIAQGKKKILVILDSPVYHTSKSGEQMVIERENYFEKNYGFPSNGLTSENFLTYDRITQLGDSLAIEWQTHEPNYGLRWVLKPIKARLRGHREPAKFLLIIGKRNYSSIPRVQRGIPKI